MFKLVVECYRCGAHGPEVELRERTVIRGGKETKILLCDECSKSQWLVLKEGDE